MSTPRELRPPTADELHAAAAVHHLDLSADEVETFSEFVADTVETYAAIDRLRPSDRGASPEREYRRPTPDEDPLNAFVSVCEVQGADDGPLAGYSVGLKDNVALAGVEMTCGASLFEGYVPSTDATVVERLLDAGATVAGKLNMEAMAFGGSGGLSDFGPVRNPHDPAYLSGGSSSGCAAAVVSGAVDVAIGTDAGGSIRRPAAWCGCVGLKPTFGLVPYTGIVGQAYTVDHAGPMARTVRDCALVLDVVAGADGRDPRQCAVEVGAYAAAVETATPDDVTVAVVEEGFGQNSDGVAVDAAIRDSLAGFAAAGATVGDCSVPLHEDAGAIWTAINLEEMTAMVRAEGVGHFVTGSFDAEYAAAFAEARRGRADEFPPTLKLTLVTGQYLADAYRGQYYVAGKNLRRRLVDAYDTALADADVLAMPTISELPYRVREGLSDAEQIDRALGLLQNRAPFNASGHPVVSVPAGAVDGFPVGVSFVGRRGDDETVLRVAAAFERTVES
ncbi:amidase [Salinirubellus salinus]|uniref:Amidase n=1 Tax=Salinirubellus salinus TaxID=1364945 RepID=A0A9E7U4L8_9EURY|nr:amidase [Salinirubellus salinus]UWM54465.1 amidase [Salinirubellus salinus]